jgi:hypothetical protein
MARRRVQYGIVDAADADVAAGAPGFRTTWQSKADLKEKLMSIDDVPKDCKLYFWDGQLWLRWEDLDDLPGSEHDPLRIKVVRPQHAGEMVFSQNCNRVDKGCLDGGALQDARGAHAFSAASCCEDFNASPGQCPSVACVCSVLNLVTMLDMLHTT